MANWLSNIFKTPRRRRSNFSRSTNSGLPSALKPKNILTSVVTRSVNQVIRKFIGSFFKSK